MTRRATVNKVGLRLTRAMCGSVCVGAGTALAQAGVSNRGEPGNTDSR